MPEPNNVETNNEPSLEQFNEPDTATQQPAANEPAATPNADGANADPKATTPSEPAAKHQEPTQPVADAYADIEKGVQVPNGLEVNKQWLQGVKDIAKQFNVSADCVKALLQFDLNDNAANAMAEQKMLDNAKAKWEQENQAKYGDNLKNVETNCSRVLAELDKDGKFKELLALVGAEKHPATLGFLKAIGDVVLEKPSVNPNATVSTDEEVELENFN